jgi:hypothetical protein
MRDRSNPAGDPKADKAAAKVRRTGQRDANDRQSDAEKGRSNQDNADAHAELVQPKYYKGRPPGGTG